MPTFKKVLADTYSPLLGRPVDPESEILVTTGASEGLLSIVMGYVEPGEEVILLEPVFSAYVLHVELAQGVPRYVSLHPPAGSESKTSSGNTWTLKMDELRAAITPKTKLLILNNPHNPIGKVWTPDELRDIGELCVRNGILMVSDEVYSRVAFTPNFTRLSTISPEIAAHTILVGSVGKLFNATGWRLGYVIGPSDLVHPVQAAHFVICYTTSGPAQLAAVDGIQEANRTDWWEQNRVEVKGKVDSFCKVLDELEIPYVYPAGAYFVMVHTAGIQIPSSYCFPPDVASLSRDMRLCWFLMNEVGIASMPGSTFYGPENAWIGENYLRFGVCKSTEALDLAKSRLRNLKPILREIERGNKRSVKDIVKM
ncbi:kynurenine aminotransferase protein [Rutstroemia sp. NJR-2017a WRK4]|nr:kynurenine aminotransferase protein [Rutstroemia sp. NJR-2017a WRK4]